jgi:isopentenyl diphosphate isomerase/L-lactate dehydrogenase-like FMN-dependent dehydrogenase
MVEAGSVQDVATETVATQDVAKRDVAKQDFATATDIIAQAHRRLPAPLWDYVSGGTETETTKQRNRDSLDEWAFRPRVLRNVSAIDPSADLLGSRLRLPVLLAPIGSLQTITADGAAASVAAAHAFGTVPIISSVSEPALETSAAVSPGDKWFQVYVRGDADWLAKLLGRVRAAHYRALVVTVDAPVYSVRERQIRHGWLPPSKTNPANNEGFQALLDWDALAGFRALAGLPLVVKGIQTVEDAELAVAAGADALYLSNHGGRQLDHARGSMTVLAEVAGRLGRRLPIIVDGGISRGTDVLKAMALGASAVAIGRLQAYALAAGGAAAVLRLLEILEHEMTTAMAMLGVTALAQLDAAYLERLGPPGRRGAFPLLPDGIAP